MSIDFGLLHGLATSVANKEHHGRILCGALFDLDGWTVMEPRWNGATVIGVWHGGAMETDGHNMYGIICR